MEKEVTYYWYHHMMLEANRNIIQTVINNHDFEHFIELFQYWNAAGLKKGVLCQDIYNNDLEFIPMIYLPATVTYEDKNGEIQEIYILQKSNFEKITYSESECG